MNNAIFFIRSPFQMLCAINALQTFNVNGDFIIIKEAGDRYLQVENMAKMNGLSYKITGPQEMPMLDKYLAVLKYAFQNKSDKVYDYVFVGDFRNINTTAYAMSFANKGAKLIYLDDGSNMIPLLQNQHRWTSVEKFKRLLNKILFMKKRIQGVCYYTIYSDIHNNKYNIVPNDMSHIANKARQDSVVLFIGTSSDVYCRSLGIEKDRYLKICRQLFRSIHLNNPGTHILYIPHGRENMQKVFDLCYEENIEVKKLDICIEYYLTLNGIKPYLVAGFGSNALFTIKKMFPETQVVNFFIKGNDKKAYEEYDNISKYYEANGIITEHIG